MEAALAAHFGTAVKLVLVIDNSAPPPERAPASANTAEPPADGPERPSSGRRATVPAPPAPDEVMDVDPSEFVEAADDEDQASAAEARLLQAFPGASEVLG